METGQKRAFETLICHGTPRDRQRVVGLFPALVPPQSLPTAVGWGRGGAMGIWGAFWCETDDHCKAPKGGWAWLVMRAKGAVAATTRPDQQVSTIACWHLVQYQEPRDDVHPQL
ncbi:hypothetical protein CIB48_g2009 [Xylaria polymorpha]|nr:hypothetical protein CIB48_g2009 [Xylaria polymorpha]